MFLYNFILGIYSKFVLCSIFSNLLANKDNYFYAQILIYYLLNI